METPHGRPALVPVIYGGVVLLLLVAGLFLRGFSRDIGDARVAGRYTLVPLLGSHSLSSLTFTWNGLSLHFSRASTPGLADFESDGGTEDIVLDSGARLRLTPGIDVGGSLTISTAGTGQSKSPLVIPFTLAGLPTDAPAGVSMAWRSAGKTFLLTLPVSADLDAGAGTITLPVDGTSWTAAFTLAGYQAVAAAPVAVAARPVTRPTSSPTRLPDEKDLPTTGQLQAVVGHWVDAAYVGWSSSRFSSTESVWSLPGGAPDFSEDIGVGLLAESVARGTWKTILPLWQDALARARSRASGPALSFATSAFDGETHDHVQASSVAAAALVQQAGTLLDSGDIAFLRIAGVVSLLLDHGTPQVFAAARAFVTGRTAATLDLSSAVALLAALTDIAEGFDSGEQVQDALREVVTRRILPAVRTTDSGLFMDTAAGAVDVALSLRCGALLIRSGAVLSDTRTSAVGRSLVSSALALGDAAGILPAKLTLASGRIASRAGAVAPETVYASVPARRLLPREVPLARQVGAGVFLWTAATLVSADKSGSTVRIVLGYPAGIPHYFAIQGLGAFTQVMMHGIPWHADPSYAKYSDGWSYDDAGKVFYGKLTGRSGQEEIDITF
jgi:hypothetical protein